MAGQPRQKLANLRALYAYMWAHPGKKLLFMGGEIAQRREWSHERWLDWDLLQKPEHAGIQALVRDLNRLYQREPALWELDGDQAGFHWLEPDDAERNVIAFLRVSRDGGRLLVFVANFSGVLLDRYRLGLPRGCRWRAAINTDDVRYGGAGLGGRNGVHPEPEGRHGQPFSAELTLPALTSIWLMPDE